MRLSRMITASDMYSSRPFRVSVPSLPPSPVMMDVTPLSFRNWNSLRSYDLRITALPKVEKMDSMVSRATLLAPIESMA